MSQLSETALVFAAVAAIYAASPVTNSGDSRFVVPTAISIARHGDADIDEYQPRFHEAAWVVENVRGHYWNGYPIGVPWLIVPPVWVLDKLLDLESRAIRENPLWLELSLASAVTAAAAALLFLYLRWKGLSLARAALLAGLFAFGTPAYSSASRGLWQHGPSMLLLVLAVLAYERRASPALIGLIAGYSYSVRPSNALLAAGFALLVWKTWGGRKLLPYAGGVAAGVLPLFVFHLTSFGAWFSPYYAETQTASLLKVSLWPLVGTLFSPSRGLFVFSPFLLCVFVRLWPRFRRKHPLTPLEMMLAAVAAGWWLAASKWPYWWGGGCYGPRLLAELAPCLVILAAPVIHELSLEQARALTLFVALSGALSIAIHLRGACDPRTLEWNSTPENVDAAPGRVWSWRDPQFLRGLGRN